MASDYIDELQRFDGADLQLHIRTIGVDELRKKLRIAKLEIQRDMRHACAESVNSCADKTGCGGDVVWLSEAHSAVMNTNIE